jgi:hypothetical protein
MELRNATQEGNAMAKKFTMRQEIKDLNDKKFRVVHWLPSGETYGLTISQCYDLGDYILDTECFQNSFEDGFRFVSKYFAFRVIKF